MTADGATGPAEATRRDLDDAHGIARDATDEIDSSIDGPAAPPRIVGLEVNQPAGYDHALAVGVARKAGVGSVTLTLPWSVLEPDEGQLEGSTPAFALPFYRDQGVEVQMSIPIIDTVAAMLPADLAAGYAAGALALDAPAIETRAKKMLDAVLASAGTELRYLDISNEVDIYLSGRPPEEWDALGRLMTALIAHVHGKHPAIQLGISVTFAGMSEARAAAITAGHDVRFVTYYRAGNFGGDTSDDFAADLDRMLAFAGDRPLVLKELGYATGPALGGTEAGQAAFVDDVFAAWDTNAARIPPDHVQPNVRRRASRLRRAGGDLRLAR